MDENELEPQKGKPKLRDLDDLSIGDLEGYIDEMETEILRVRREIDKKNRHREGIENLFKRC